MADDVEARSLLCVRLIDRGQPVKEVKTLVARRRQRGGPLCKRHIPTGRLAHDGTPAVSRPLTSVLDNKGRVTSPAAARRDPAYLARIARSDERRVGKECR